VCARRPVNPLRRQPHHQVELDPVFAEFHQPELRFAITIVLEGVWHVVRRVEQEQEGLADPSLIGVGPCHCRSDLPQKCRLNFPQLARPV
jgi:hypothetical protein